ncbi:inositol-pentakisphosphate 2-kinase [Powellomyces hirtus]|nr:inositol-pentakisphosphate 2-kinase [Powellomyces hirtus]
MGRNGSLIAKTGGTASDDQLELNAVWRLALGVLFCLPQLTNMLPSQPIDSSQLLDAALWSYKGEGNANIVVAYIGPDPLITGCVLRVRKALDEVVRLDEVPVPSPFTLQYEMGFQQHVVAPLVGPEYVGRMQLVNVNPTFLHNLSDSIADARPKARRTKLLDFSQPYAALIADLTYVPHLKMASPTKVVAVEIKPKWGFLPTSPAIDSNNAIKLRTCRYCMHQLWKAKECESHTASGFCPLDLYSREEDRIRKAFDSLLPNAQNNLRLFLDGQRLNLTLSTGAALNNFFHPADASAHDPSSTGLASLFENLIAILTRDNLLQRLRYHQRNLDSLDIEGIFPLYATLPDDVKNANPSLSEWKETMDLYQQRIEQNDDIAAQLSKCSPKERLQFIHEYLLAATLKDCSIIIAMWLEDPNSTEPSDTPANEGTVRLDTSSQVLRYRVGILDIDPKRITKIPDYYKLDQNIVEHFKKMGVEKDCA